MRTRFFAILLCLVTVTACAKEDTKQNDASVTTASKTNDEVIVESMIDATVEDEYESATSSSTEDLYTGQELAPIYASFLQGETKVHIDPENDFVNPWDPDDDYKITSTKKDFTLDELVNSILDKLSESGFTGTEFDSIEYASIDCGNDGQKELLLKICMPNQVDSNTEILILKDFNGSLKAIYSTVATCRRNLFINEFGYICSGGGSGTSDYYDKSFVGSDSKWHFLYTVEYKDEPYYDSDKSYVVLIQFTEDDIVFSEDAVYTLAKDNYDTSDIDYENGYPDYRYDKFPRGESDDVFKKYLDEFKDNDWPTLPLSDADKIISDREKSEGLTAEIKNGKTADWKKLDYELTH
ncbi:hypothetical protein [Ruminococcus sp.]|uniref:hypothetical protein n=1 Tax=Ruminococcus sp. TaxID=41978 RepID=UPI0025D3058C|nr:hypothetical protein [Ruminococcus sp.]